MIPRPTWACPTCLQKGPAAPAGCGSHAVATSLAATACLEQPGAHCSRGFRCCETVRRSCGALSGRAGHSSPGVAQMAAAAAAAAGVSGSSHWPASLAAVAAVAEGDGLWRLHGPQEPAAASGLSASCEPQTQDSSVACMSAATSVMASAQQSARYGSARHRTPAEQLAAWRSMTVHASAISVCMAGCKQGAGHHLAGGAGAGRD